MQETAPHLGRWTYRDTCCMGSDCPSTSLAAGVPLQEQNGFAVLPRRWVAENTQSQNP